MPSSRKKLNVNSPYRLVWSPQRILWVSKWSDSLIPQPELKKLETAAWFRTITSSESRKNTAHGRWVARKALQQKIGRDVGWLERRLPPHAPTPVWPTPIHGSISHTLDYAAVFVTADGSSPGIDIQAWMTPEQATAHVKQLNSKKIEIPLFPFSCTEFEKLTLLWSLQESFYKSLQNIGINAPARNLMHFKISSDLKWTGSLIDDPSIALQGQLALFDDFSLCFGILDI